MSNEGSEEESEISKEVVADDDLLLCAKSLGDLSDFSLDLEPFFFGVFGGLIVEPFGVDVG